MSKFVTADAQFGIENVLRPFEGFADVYDGTWADRPIMFTKPKLLNGTWGEPLDKLVSSPLIRDDLLRGLAVPYGARVIIKIPVVGWDTGVSPTVLNGYNWVIWWRSRNLYDYRNARIPWHFPSQAVNQSEGKGGTITEVPIVPAGNSIVYSQVESDNREQVQHLKVDEVSQIYLPFTTDIGPALIPNGGFGKIGQGLGFGDGNTSPYVATIEVAAIGDELLIGAYRDNSSIERYDFSGTDTYFNQHFGTADESGPFKFRGPIVSYGSAP